MSEELIHGVTEEERERKFLCKGFDHDAAGKPQGAPIVQGYLKTGDPEVRIRKKGDRYIEQVKWGHGESRRESPDKEGEVSPVLGEALLMACESNVLRKIRYKIDRWEIDVYQGALEGLVTMEIELDHEGESLPGYPPGVAVEREITGQVEFSNAALASMSEREARELVSLAFPPRR